MPLLPTGFDRLVLGHHRQQINVKFASALRARSSIWRARRSATCAPSHPAARGRFGCRSCGAALFWLQARYLIDAAQAVAGGKLDIENLSEGSAIAAEKALTDQRGIGTWTARYVLMRAALPTPPRWATARWPRPFSDCTIAGTSDADHTARLMSPSHRTVPWPLCIYGPLSRTLPKGTAMKKYWSLIESPFQKFAAWVDEEGRLLRFNLRAAGPARSIPRLRTMRASWPKCSASDTVCQWQAPRFRS